MEIEFYNVKRKCRVKIKSSEVQAVKYEKQSKKGSVRIRYALKAIDSDGTKLTKFCSESDYNKLK